MLKRYKQEEKERKKKRRHSGDKDQTKADPAVKFLKNMIEGKK